MLDIKYFILNKNVGLILGIKLRKINYLHLLVKNSLNRIRCDRLAFIFNCSKLEIFRRLLLYYIIIFKFIPCLLKIPYAGISTL